MTDKLKTDLSEFQFRIRFPIMALGILALLVGLWSGLQRIGWQLPPRPSSWAILHGPLMVCGFLGTVIGMERAVAGKKLWQYLAPVATGLGGILLVSGRFETSPLLLFNLGSLILVIMFIQILIKFPALHHVVMTIGAVLFFLGNLIWLSGFPLYHVALWWAGFLILTIAGERLELSRILKPPTAVKMLFFAANTVLIAGIILATFVYSTGMAVAGIGMLALCLWLLRFDLARKSVKKPGLPRFIAVALIVGYLWLGVAGVLALIYGEMTAGPFYDAILHAVFLGFVFSMIFGHAPIIFPAVLKIEMEFKSRFYIHLGLLHLSLVFRVIADISGWIDGRLWGSLLNGFAILLFLINTISSKKKSVHG